MSVIVSSFSAENIATYLGKCTNHFAIFGAVCCGYLAWKVGKNILAIGARAIRRSLPVDLTKYGRWAVVTGCTDGIGKCYALQLAEKGLDLVLISRNPEKLSKVVEEIRQRSKVKVKVIVADFKKTDIYQNIKKELEGLDIGLLVNNVGMLNPKNPCYFLDPEDFEQYNMEIVNVNILSCVMMTGIVLPEMLERQRGMIINIGSGAGARPLPFFSLYSATKGFILFFTQALNMEYSDKGVNFQLVMPHMVESNMSRDLSNASGMAQGLFVPKAEVFVRKAIQTIGRESTTCAYWPHELQHFLVEHLSESFLTTAMKEESKKMADYLKKK